MKIDHVLKKLRNNLPRTAQEVLDDCELPLQYIGGGAYRDAYQIVGTSLVLKIPRKMNQTAKSYRKNILHSRNEFKIWRNVLKSKRKYVELQKYMPEIIYHNTYTGLTMMRLYEAMGFTSASVVSATALGNLVSRVTGRDWCDIGYRNVGVDAGGGLVLTDLGHLIGNPDL